MNAEYADVVERAFEVNSGDKLKIHCDHGEVRVEGIQGKRCLIKVFRKVSNLSEDDARNRLEKLEIDFNQKKDTIEFRLGDDASWWQRVFGENTPVEVIVEVSLPRNFDLEAHTNGGDIEVKFLDGDLELASSGGDLKLKECGGEAELKTAGGDIVVETFLGPLDMKSSGGDIIADRTQGELDAKTSGGDIRIGNHSGNIDAQSTGGDIHAALRQNGFDDIDLNSTGGDIRLILPDHSAFKFRAKAFGGDITTQFKNLKTIDRGFTEWEAEVNGGGEAKVELRSLGGDIIIDILQSKAL